MENQGSHPNQDQYDRLHNPEGANDIRIALIWYFPWIGHDLCFT